jgi:hypothetical protein
MIDTCKVYLSPDTEFSQSNFLTIQPCSYYYKDDKEINNATLFVDTGGNIVEGSKAYYNDKQIQFDINHSFENLLPKRKETLKEFNVKKYLGSYYTGEEIFQKNINVNLKSEQLYNSAYGLKFSLPKYYDGENNFNALSDKKIKKCFNDIENKLYKLGIKTNLKEATLSRLDCFQNIITDENYHAYTPIFSLMKLSRKKNFEYAGTTFLWRNGSHQITIYEKIEEMMNRSKDKTQFGLLPPQVMRIENRLMNKRKINDSLKLLTVNDLVRNLPAIRDNYRDLINKNVFRYEPDEIEIMTKKDIIGRMESFKANGNKRWFYDFVFYHGIHYISTIIDFETLVRALEEVVENRMKKSRILKKIEDSRLNNKFVSKSTSGKTYATLYNELKNKFLKAA